VEFVSYSPVPYSVGVSSAAARYDGHSEWYDETAAAWAGGEEAAFLAEHLGAGDGEVCLDVACGTGLYGQTIRDAGYRVAGFDISADQIRFAHRRLTAAIRADARFLPLRDAVVPVAAGMFFSTDVEDFAAVVREVARCLRPGGRFICLALHPCFNGPFVDRTAESRDGRLTFVGGYGKAQWANRGSGDGTGLWGRVGGHHKTLEGILGAIAGSGLNIRVVREFFSGWPVLLPWNLGLVAEKPRAPLRRSS
jgi:SAM-dependent methyltransferase